MSAARKEQQVRNVAETLGIALRRLAGVCDGASSWDGHGFNKFDTERGHRFAKENCGEWDAKKCSYILKFLWKYRVQLKDNHGIDLEQIEDPAKINMAQRTVEFNARYGGQFAISWDYNDPEFGAIKDEVKAIEQRRYDGGTKVWMIPANLSEEVEALAKRFGFSVSDEATNVMEGVSEVPAISNIRMGHGDGNLEFAFPYDPGALSDLKGNWIVRKWDREDRLWRVNVQDRDEAELVLEFAKKYNLTVDKAVRDMVERLVSDGKKKERRTQPSREAVQVKVAEEHHERSEMGRDWSAGDACKLFE